jgi:hypothetical protein
MPSDITTSSMAVQAPIAGENPPKAARLPHVNAPEVTGDIGGRKRGLSEDHERENVEVSGSPVVVLGVVFGLVYQLSFRSPC